jgi:hypothetical protein
MGPILIAGGISMSSNNNIVNGIKKLYGDYDDIPGCLGLEKPECPNDCESCLLYDVCKNSKEAREK